jgi:hypothetical protein
MLLKSRVTMFEDQQALDQTRSQRLLVLSQMFVTTFAAARRFA